MFEFCSNLKQILHMTRKSLQLSMISFRSTIQLDYIRYMSTDITIFFIFNGFTWGND